MSAGDRAMFANAGGAEANLSTVSGVQPGDSASPATSTGGFGALPNVSYGGGVGMGGMISPETPAGGFDQPGAFAGSPMPETYASTGGMGGNGRYFADGGAVGDDDNGGDQSADGGQEDANGDNDGQQDPSPDGALGAPMGNGVTDALSSVEAALAYGRNLHGLGGAGTTQTPGGGEEPRQAANMPAIPPSQSESGIPRPQPFGTLPPTKNPFGKRMAAAMPMIPGNQSESGIPKPQPFGTLPPTNNPFGKRADASQDGAIPTDDDEG
jgi:hypothetical protein